MDRIPLRARRGHFFAIAAALLFLPIFSFLIWSGKFTPYFVYAGTLEAGSASISATIEGPAGGPALYPSSVVFLSGARNSRSGESGAVSFNSFSSGAGPADPSLASVSGGALLKSSSPLTIASAANTRRGSITYTVRAGDAPSVIAARFGITTNTLLWANNLSEGQYIKPGDELVVLPVSGVRYKVRSGDTLSAIAGRFGGDVSDIVAFNNLPSGSAIIEGEYIIIPDGEMPARVYAPRYSAYAENLDGLFIHPTAGIGYISRGLHPYNAIDIAAPCWTPIYSSADGTVSISDGYGWNGGYGRYVKINHDNGSQSIYAHNIQNKVSVGQYVKQGQLVAYIGSTGRSSGCHVHWEVYGALNPLR